MKEILSVNKLKVDFHTHASVIHAVRGVSFSLYEGESIAIVGESGCGKTAMAKSIMRLLSPPIAHIKEGSILYKETDLLSLKEKQMRSYRGKEIGMIFQDPLSSLNPTMKIGKQITEGYLQHFPRTSKKKATEHAMHLLHLVGIPQPETRYNQYAHELSGGMRQRVMIAIALSASPKILIADEPTTALDVTIQAQILDLLKEIQQKTGTGIILITHDLSIVASLCNRMLVMYGGIIVESGSVHELFTNPSHPYTQKLLNALPRMDHLQENNLLAIEGTPPDLRYLQPGCPFWDRCNQRKSHCKLSLPPLIKKEKGKEVRCFLYE